VIVKTQRMSNWWDKSFPLPQDELERYNTMFVSDEEEEEEEEEERPVVRISKGPRTTLNHLIPGIADSIKAHVLSTQTLAERNNEIEKKEMLLRIDELKLENEMMSFYVKKQQQPTKSDLFDMSQAMQPMDEVGFDQLERLVSLDTLFLSSQRGEIDFKAGIVDNRRIFCIKNLQTNHETYHVFTL
jgi:hypothetical protein